MRVIDPIKFCNVCWPDIELYNKQREILYSVRDNDETYVPGGNDMGKDFIAAIAALWFFVSRRPCKVVTTSVKGDQLGDVLWGEIRRLIDTSRRELPLQYNHLYIRHVRKDGTLDPRSSLAGQVCRQGESLAGRHIEREADGVPKTLAIFDEASGIDDQAYTSSDTWTHRKLIIGNPYPCTNFFYNGVRGGDIESPVNNHLFRKVIRIRAEDSPNVRRADVQKSRGKKPTGEIVVPGVLDYFEYVKRRALWDGVRQCIGLDGEFYEGAETLLYPPDWLNRAEAIAGKLPSKRRAETIGVDSAEGGDNTAWAMVDSKGLIKLISIKTPDTSIITGRTLALMEEYNVLPEDVLFDAGGGGKEHADRLRSQGYNVQTIAFGGSPTLPRRRGMRPMEQRKGEDETKQAYKNRRAEMYGVLRNLLDPTSDEGFGLPTEYTELRQQMSVMPLDYDDRGRMQLPPKGSHSKAINKSTTKPTLTELIGHSPDEADALVLAAFGLTHKSKAFTVRSMV